MAQGGGAYGQGTAFKVSLAGQFTLLHTFGYGLDGAVPMSKLVNGPKYDGKYYGVTSYGGTNGLGTVYSITLNGTEQVLYSFAGGADGAYPSGAVRNLKGTYYGLTSMGGSYNAGTLFSITNKGQETVLHSFGYGTDGADPEGAVSSAIDTLYGTTMSGGAFAQGTVFSYKP